MGSVAALSQMIPFHLSPSVSPTPLQEEEDRGKRQVLVLGLDGAGKSSMLQGLSVGEAEAPRGRCRPTRGFNFMSLNVPACQLDFLESKAANTPGPGPESRPGFWDEGRLLTQRTFRSSAVSHQPASFHQDLNNFLSPRAVPPPRTHTPPKSSYLRYSCVLLDLHQFQRLKQL